MWIFNCLGRPGYFWQHVKKISAILLKNPTVYVFFHLSIPKQYKIGVPAHCSIRSKKLTGPKNNKKSILALKFTFVDQKRLKISNQLSMFPIMIQIFEKRLVHFISVCQYVQVECQKPSYCGRNSWKNSHRQVCHLKILKYNISILA